jgi:hypothetical protein
MKEESVESEGLNERMADCTEKEETVVREREMGESREEELTRTRDRVPSPDKCPLPLLTDLHE